MKYEVYKKIFYVNSFLYKSNNSIQIRLLLPNYKVSVNQWLRQKSKKQKKARNLNIQTQIMYKDVET